MSTGCEAKGGRRGVAACYRRRSYATPGGLRIATSHPRAGAVTANVHMQFDWRTCNLTGDLTEILGSASSSITKPRNSSFVCFILLLYHWDHARLLARSRGNEGLLSAAGVCTAERATIIEHGAVRVEPSMAGVVQLLVVYFASSGKHACCPIARHVLDIA